MGFCIAFSLFLRFRNTLQLFVKYNLVKGYQNFFNLDPTMDKKGHSRYNYYAWQENVTF